MRVTNAMTTGQLLLDLNRSMNSLNFLEYQVRTGNKIRYASDDPIIAARALKFRTNLAETNQYLSNVDQGKAWLDSTAGPVKNILEALVNGGQTSVRSLLVDAANGTKTISDSKIYANQIRETLNEILGELNTSYAGRYLFSGLKTDQKTVFDTNQPHLNMKITENFTFDDIDKDYRVYLKLNKVLEVDDSKAFTGTPAVSGLSADEYAMPQEVSVIRLKLAYGTNISGLVGLKPPLTPNDIKTADDPDAYLPADDAIHFIQETGELIFGKKAYEAIEKDLESNVSPADKAVDAVKALIQATIDLSDSGKATSVINTELKDAKAALNALVDALGDDTRLELIGKVDDDTTPTFADGVLVDYLETAQKLLDETSSFLAAVDTAHGVVKTKSTAADEAKAAYEANPIATTKEAYRIAKAEYEEAKANLQQQIQAAQKGAYQLGEVTNKAAKDAKTIELQYEKNGFYAQEINPVAYFNCTDITTQKSYTIEGQEMEFEFGIGNRMQVNTLGKNVLTTDLLNDIYDCIKLAESIEISDKDELIDEYMKNDPTLSREDAIKRAEEQINDEQKFYQDMVTKKFTSLIGKIDKHSDQISKENTSIGAKLNRLELISNRLLDDRVNFEELKTNNENVDMEEAYIRYQSMYTVYQSALQMGAKVVQMTLVNFI